MLFNLMMRSLNYITHFLSSFEHELAPLNTALNQLEKNQLLKHPLYGHAILGAIFSKPQKAALFVEALEITQRGGLLDHKKWGEPVFDALLQENDAPHHLAYALLSLQEQGLLAHPQYQDAVFQAILSAPLSASFLSSKLIHLHHPASLDVLAFTLKYWPYVCGTSRLCQRYMSLSALVIQNHQKKFIEIINTYKDRPKEAHLVLLHYIEYRILAVHLAHVHLNPHESTHSAVVHQSVSQSLLNLKNRYENQLNFKHLDSLETLLFSLHPTPIYRAAQRSFLRIKNEELEQFIEPLSRISLKESLTLCWLALSDESKRTGLKEDAFLMLVEGLYEIQRGYNIEAQMSASQGEDQPICIAGAFNKLIEKMVSLHPDIELIIMNRASATAKFMALTQEKSLIFLQNNPSTMASFKLQGMSFLWTHIQEKVISLMLAEFGSLFPQGANDAGLLEISQAIEDIEINVASLNANAHYKRLNLTL